MSDLTSAASLMETLQPYLLSLEAVIVPALVGWGITVLNRWTGEKMDQNAQEKLIAAATNEAGKIILAADRSIANAKLDERSSIVVASADKIVNAPGLQDAIKRLGITPNGVASLVAGALGQAQKSMSADSGGLTLAPPPNSLTSVVGDKAIVQAPAPKT